MSDIEDRIRQRANALWMAEGQPDGRATEHWDAAQRELGLSAAEVRSGTFENGDPLRTQAQLSLQEKPQITEHHVLMPDHDSADVDKAPITPKIFSPQRPQ